MSTHLSARRTRLRRAAALGAMLTAVGGLVAVRSALTPPPTPAASSAGLASPVHGTGTRSPSGRPSQSSSSAASRAPRRQQVLGNAYDVSYGTVQVRVTLDGRRITDVTAVTLPQGGHSGDISSYAAPALRREALSAQSAHIDTVSGASYTSAGYAQSLQSALDKARR
jgi:uncharacterized protein with FMN-binding domain